MLSKNTGKKLHTYVPDYVIFDLETTGFSCTSDAVVEIAAVKVQSGSVVDENGSDRDRRCPGGR